MKSFARIVSTVVATLLAYPAFASEADDVADARCLVVAFSLMNSGQSNLQSAGSMSALYYFGRLGGRSPNADLEALLVKQLKAMSGENISAEASRCGDALTVKGQEITQIGQHIIKMAQSSGKNAPSEEKGSSSEGTPAPTK